MLVAKIMSQRVSVCFGRLALRLGFNRVAASLLVAQVPPLCREVLGLKWWRVKGWMEFEGKSQVAATFPYGSQVLQNFQAGEVFPPRIGSAPKILPSIVSITIDQWRRQVSTISTPHLWHLSWRPSSFWSLAALPSKRLQLGFERFKGNDAWKNQHPWLEKLGHRCVAGEFVFPQNLSTTVNWAVIPLQETWFSNLCIPNAAYTFSPQWDP